MEMSSGSGIGAFPLLLLVALGLVLLAVWAGSVAWVWRDADRRGQPGFIVAVLVALLFWPLSVVVWLLVRPSLTPANAGLRASRTWSIALVVLIALAVGGWVAWDLLKAPRFAASWNDSSGKVGFLAVESEPPGATVTIRLLSNGDTLRYGNIDSRVNATFQGTEIRTIGMTPVLAYQLPTSSLRCEKYTSGYLRGSTIQVTERDCIYEVEVRKDLYHAKTFSNVILTPGKTTGLKAELTEMYPGTVKYPGEKGGAK